MTIGSEEKSVCWNNEDSIYYHKPGEFLDFIVSIADRSISVLSALQRFRERKCLPKRFKEMKIEELRQNNQLIAELYNSLRNGMEPQGKLSLPFSTNSAERGPELIGNLSEYGFNINISRAKCKIVKGHYNGEGLDYHYIFELVAAPYKEPDPTCGGQFDFIGMVNSLPGIDNGHQYFAGASKVYKWLDSKGKGGAYDNPWRTASSISEILQQCGFDGWLPPSRRKHPCVFVANLISPRIDWQGGYGKSRLANLRAFADDIVKAAVSVAGQMPTFHGWGLSESTNAGRPLKIEVLLEVLQARKREWESLSAEAKRKSWWTQSDVYYATRKLLLEYGYEDDEIDKGTRNYLTGKIRSICEKILHAKREDIGIIAADRAQYNFKGEWRDVGLKEIEELSQCGQDMLVIEKEGIAEQLAPFADEMGIGLLNTRGFPVEYAEILAKISAQKRCNVAILTDFDDSGLLMAARAPNIYRVGIDFQTLNDLDLDIAEVEEAYNPGKHFKSLKLGGEYYGVYSDEILDYIKHKRIEINSIITALHDNARFWEWILEKLRKQFHDRNYNRSITVPEYVIPECLESLIDKVKEKGIAILKQRREKLQDRLSDIGPGFLFDRTNEALKDSAKDIPMTIPKYEDTLIEHSKHIIESDNGIRPLLDKIEDLTEDDDEDTDEFA